MVKHNDHTTHYIFLTTYTNVIAPPQNHRGIFDPPKRINRHWHSRMTNWTSFITPFAQQMEGTLLFYSFLFATFHFWLCPIIRMSCEFHDNIFMEKSYQFKVGNTSIPIIPNSWTIIMQHERYERSNLNSGTSCEDFNTQMYTSRSTVEAGESHLWRHYTVLGNSRFKPL